MSGMSGDGMNPLLQIRARQRPDRASTSGQRVFEEQARSPAALFLLPLSGGDDHFEGVDRQGAQTLDQVQKELRRGHGVVQGTVGVGQIDARLGAEAAQAVAGHAGQQDGGQFEGVQRGSVKLEPGRGQKAQIKARVVGNDRVHIRAHKGHQLGDHLFDGRRIGHIFVADAGQLLDLQRDRAFWIDQGREALCDAIVLDANGRHLGDGVPVGVQSRGFQVKSDKDTLCHMVVSFQKVVRMNLRPNDYAGRCANEPRIRRIRRTAPDSSSD